MIKYDSYKDSKIEWIGEIPEHWKITPIKNVAEIRGRIGWRALSTEDYVDDGFILLGVRNISEKGELVLKDLTRIPLEKYDESPEIQVQQGDVLLAKTGATIGKSCVIRKVVEPMTVNAAVNIFRLKHRINPVYFNHIISSEQTQYQFWANTAENARGNLFQRDIAKVLIPFTENLTEQTAIAAYLDRKTAEIDELIANKKRLIELYEEEKTAIINQAVTKGINPDVPMKPSGIEWLGDVPEHWEVKKLKHVSFLKSGENIVSEQIKEIEKYPVYGGNGLRGFFDNFTHEGEYILIGRQGAYCGNIKYAKGRFWASEHAVVLSPLVNYHPFYLGELLRSMNLNQYSISAAQPGLSVEVIKNLTIPFPPMGEQKSIAVYCDGEFNRIENKISNTQKLIDLLTEYRTALISEVVTGKVKIVNL